MNMQVFKRKAYNKLLEWKLRSNGRSAILIEGATFFSQIQTIHTIKSQSFNYQQITTTTSTTPKIKTPKNNTIPKIKTSKNNTLPEFFIKL